MGNEASPAPRSRSVTHPEFPIPRTPRAARLTRCLPIAVCLLALAPGAAHAASVGLAGTSLRVTTGIGEANNLTVTLAAGVFTVTDAGTVAMTGGTGCEVLSAPSRVTCPSTGVGTVVVDAGDGDDIVTLTGVTQPATLTDGPGNDVVTGGSGNDVFIGGTGDDRLTGGAGNDSFGDAGGAGADTLAGGSGSDTANYSTRTAPLSVTLDGLPGDGVPGENDDVDVEVVDGGTAGDRLIGSASADTLRGNGGPDVLDGLGGSDTLSGGSDQDTVDYSARSAALTVTLDGTANDGSSGEADNVGTDVDIVLGGSGNDTITGHGSVNELRGNTGDDTLNGSGGDDVLRGDAGTDRLDGGTGNDALDGGTGTDNHIGGTGTDAVDYSARTETITGDLSRTTGFGEAGENDTVAADVEGISGGSGADVLIGSSSANALRGNAGDDVLDGRLGADDVSGGDGTDSVSYAARTAGVTIRLDNSANDGQTGETDNIRNDVEHLTGTSADDRIYADDDANTIVGNGGSDTIYGYGADDAITTGGGGDQVWGGAGNDSIAGGEGTNKLYGEDGNDALTAGSGADTVEGGNGDDGLDAGAGNDKVQGAAGNDTIDAGAGDDSGDAGTGDDRVQAGDGNDSLSGGDGDDALEGATGIDTLNGNNGADFVAGGEGNDKVAGNDGNDLVGGGAGDDQVWGGAGDDQVTDAEGANRLYGEDGLDKLTGGAGIDQLSGGNDDDLLDGGASDDTLNGDNGNDRLQGGPEADRLYGGSGDDVLDGGLGPDQIDGAEGTDTIDYGGRTEGVTVTNDGKADDGQKGEADNVASTVDNAIGSSGADRITFVSDWPHHLDGGDGNDLLRGGPRDDTLVGGRGNDLLRGQGGTDSYDGGPGADHLGATDGLAEKLRCGTDKDISVQDKIDTAVSCEKRTIGKLAAGGSPGAAGTPTPSNAIPVAEPVAAPSGFLGVKRVSSRGRFVPLPGVPGVRVDRRIVADVSWIRKRFRIRITAGYELKGHAISGEHPLGLALDIVPGPGGSWDDVDRLAKWAEPRQNRTRAPFRWVGYNGDVNHGRGHHLHLSWMHGASRPGKPAPWVVAMRFKRSAAGTGAAPRGAGALIRYAKSSNARLGGTPSVNSGFQAIEPCQGAELLKPTLKAAALAFGLRWRILAALTETESGFGCNMGPSSAGAIGWTQFLPSSWKSYGMDADGDGKADPFSSVDAVYSSARLLRASGAPKSYRRALYAYNHSWDYVNLVLARAKKY